MTNPTLERAARAAAVACEQVRPSDEHDAEAWSYIVRAVLMAVLPELHRHGDEGYVYYDDLTAIIAEGE